MSKRVTLVVALVALGIVVFNNFQDLKDLVWDFWTYTAFAITISTVIIYFMWNKDHLNKII